MTIFWVIVALLTAGALLFLLPPLLQRGGAMQSAAHGLTLAIYRDQLAELNADHAAGLLSESQHAAARMELERRLLEDVDAVAGAKRPARGGKAAALLVGLAVPLLAVGLYRLIGNPAALAPGMATQGAGNSHELSAQQIGAMVDKLALRLAQNPEDAEGWVMLARSYGALGRFQDASAAYARATERAPGNASLLADYADALAMARGRRLQGEPEALILRALKADPNHIKALALAGSAAFEKQEYAAAVRHWERIVQLAPPQSDIARSIGGSIRDARRLGGLAAAAPAGGAAAAAPAGVSGTVRLAPALAAKVAPDDTVFIFARALDGPRMPLAVLRRKAGELPVTFTLDDSLAMSPQARLSGAPRIIVGARVSKSASATPQAGDLQGQSLPVGNVARDVTVLIDKVIY